MVASAASSFTGLLCASISDDGVPTWEKGFDAVLAVNAGAAGVPPALLISNNATKNLLLQAALTPKTVWRANSVLLFVSPHGGQQGGSACLALKCASPQAADEVMRAVEAALAPAASGSGQLAAAAGGGSGNGSGSSHFDRKTDKGSADLYFHYYSLLMHQQNMLQDYTRTGLYHMAITDNRSDFEGKVVMDVGAGSGILSLFAAQAGAKKVYAVEASGMAQYARRLADANASLGPRIEVVRGKVEEVSIPEKVDVLISEPMGTLLVNERMLESYIFARDNFLKPGGKMFPQVGRIHAALFTDELLHAEVAAKALFWTQNSFYGVDVTALYPSAVDSYFGQAVVDAFDPNLLVSTCATKIFDFGTCAEKELHDITMPLQLQVTAPGPCLIHGLASWFDVFFNGANNPVWLTTAPGMPTTHWFQLRCLLKSPLFVAGPGTVVTGTLRLVAHSRQSYDVHVTLEAPPVQPGQPPQKVSGTFDLKEPYYRQLTAQGWYQQQQQAAAQDGAAAAPGFAGQ